MAGERLTLENRMIDHQWLTEPGYTPKNLTALLYQALPDTKARREELARRLDVSLDTVQRWCVDTNSKRHADMPLVRWRQALNVLEADQEAMRAVLRQAILDAINDQNLVYADDDAAPVLRCSYCGEGCWHINLQPPAGNAYVPGANECFVAIGISADSVDYSESDAAADEDTADTWTELDDEQATTDRAVEDNIDAWTAEIFEVCGPDFDGEEF